MTNDGPYRVLARVGTIDRPPVLSHAGPRDPCPLCGATYDERDIRVRHVHDIIQLEYADCDDYCDDPRPHIHASCPKCELSFLCEPAYLKTKAKLSKPFFPLGWMCVAVLGGVVGAVLFRMLVG